MSQIIHIFLKDVRRLWIEVAVSLIALAVLTRTEWWLCTPERNEKWYSVLLPVVVVFFSWWFLLVRLIQDESPVGDSAFWITRPYAWQKLVSAKVLFALVFILLPFGISDIVLLVANGDSVVAHLGSIAETMAGTTVAGLLGFAAIATLTRNVGQWILCTVGVILIVIGAMMLTDWYVKDSHVSTGTEWADDLQAVVFTCFASAAIVLQFARRKRLLAAAIFGTGILALPLIVVAVPYRSIIEHTFVPAAKLNNMPYKLAFLQDEPAGAGAGKVLIDDEKKTVRLEFPVEVSGIPEDTLLKLDGLMLAIHLPNEQWWESEWLTEYGEEIGGRERLKLSSQIDESIFERVRAIPTDARLWLAFSEMLDRERRPIQVQPRFELPGVGQCWLAAAPFVERSVQCRSAESEKNILLTAVYDAETDCLISGGSRLPGNNEVVRSLRHGSGDGPLNPLGLETFSLFSRKNPGNRPTNGVCKNDFVTVSTPQLKRRFRLDVNLGKVKLQDFAQRRLNLDDVRIERR